MQRNKQRRRVSVTGSRTAAVEPEMDEATRPVLNPWTPSIDFVAEEASLRGFMDFHGHTHTHTHTHTHRSVMIPLMFPLTDESVIGGGSSCLQLSESQWAASAARGRLIDYWFLSSLYSRSTTSVLKHRTKQNKQEIKAATEMLPPNWIFVFKSDGRADVLINSSCRSESRSLSAGESPSALKASTKETSQRLNLCSTLSSFLSSFVWMFALSGLF